MSDSTFELSFSDNVNWAMRVLESQLGKKWLSRARPDETHPLRRAWAFYHSSPRSQPTLPDELARAVLFAHHLDALAKFPSKDKRGSVRNDSKFLETLVDAAKRSVAGYDGAEFEAMIARLYRDRYQIPIVSLIPSNEGQRPDFELKFHRQIIYIECKARVTLTPKEERILRAKQGLFSSIFEALRSAAVNYGVHVLTKGIPTTADYELVQNELESLMQSGTDFHKDVGGYAIRGLVLGALDQEFIGTVEESRGQFTITAPMVDAFLDSTTTRKSDHYSDTKVFAQHKFDGSKYMYKNPRVAVLELLVIPNNVKAVENMIASARRQLPKGVPGTIFINSPEFYGREQFAELGRRMKGALYSSRRISAVVLWHRVIETTSSNQRAYSDLETQLRFQVVPFRNPRADDSLPDDFYRHALPPSGLSKNES